MIGKFHRETFSIVRATILTPHSHKFNSLRKQLKFSIRMELEEKVFEMLHVPIENYDFLNLKTFIEGNSRNKETWAIRGDILMKLPVRILHLRIDE